MTDDRQDRSYRTAYDAGYRQAVADALAASDVAARLGVTPQHVNLRTHELDLPHARKVGRYTVYWPADLDILASRRDGRRKGLGQP